MPNTQTHNLSPQAPNSEPLTPKVAIAADWLIGGGAEKVVEQLHKMYPEAPIYTSYCTDEWRRRLEAKVVTGWLQHWPFSILRKFIPFLRVWWFSRLDLSGYDLVISSSGAEAKFVNVRRSKLGAGSWVNKFFSANSLPPNSKSPTPKPLHVAYVHAPTHYYWSRYDDYLKHPGFGMFDPLARLGLRMLVGPLRKLDFKAAQRPDFLIANSGYTKAQIQKCYGRGSEVIHPPVDVERFAKAAKDSHSRSGFIITGRQTPYKRVDLAVEACSQLGVPLVVVGNGPDHRRLVKMSAPNVTFLTKVSDAELPKLLASAQAFIFPGVDDFGISAVEALAAGTPVIAYCQGGALDYVNKTTGLLFDEQSLGGLAKALAKFDSKDFQTSQISLYSQRFAPEAFEKSLKNFIENLPLGTA